MVHYMAQQYSSSSWSCNLSKMAGLALCLLVMLSYASSSYARLLLNRTRGGFMVSREAHRRNLLDNGLGHTPPMG